MRIGGPYAVRLKSWPFAQLGNQSVGALNESRNM